jgi:hypothetical protein
MPPYWFRQRFELDGHLEMRQHLCKVLALVQQPVTLAALALDLPLLTPRRLLGVVTSPTDEF